MTSFPPLASSDVLLALAVECCSDTRLCQEFFCNPILFEPTARSMAEPACAAARTEVMLFRDELARGFLERARRLRSREEVHVDTTDAAGTELDVAGAGSVVLTGFTAAPQLGDQRSGNNAALPLGEDSRFRHPHRGDVSECVHAGKPRFERSRAHRYIAVFGHSARHDYLWSPVLGNAEEEVIGKLGAVVEHCDAARRIERAHAVAGDKLDITLGESLEQRARRIR